MADLEKTISIVFGAVDRTGGVIEGVGTKLTAVAAGVRAATDPLANAVDLLFKVEAAVGAVALAIAAFSANESIKFKGALLDLQKVLGEGEGNAEDYSDQIGQLAIQYGIAGTDVLQSAADFRQSGFVIAEALGLTEASLTAAKISELDTAAASEKLIAILNGFQAPASQANNVLDILNETSNKNAASFGALAEGMAILSPTARQLGLTIAETAGYLTPVIEVYGSGSEAAVGLRTSFLRLLDPTKEARQALDEVEKQLGVNIRTNGSFSETMEDLAAVWPRLNDQTKAFLTSQLAGLEQSGKFAVVLDNLAKVATVTTDALNSSGSAAEELAVRLQAPEEVINRTIVKIKTAARTMGDEYIGELVGVIDATGDLAIAFKEVVDNDGLEPLFEALRPLLAGLDADIRAVARAMPEAFSELEYDDLLAAFGDLGEAVAGIFGGVDLTTPDGLRRAMQLVIDVGTGLIRVTSGIVEGFEPVIEALVEGAKGFSELDKETQKAVGNILGVGKALNVAAGLIDGLGGAVEAVGSGVAAIAGAAGISVVAKTLSYWGEAAPGISKAAGATLMLARGISGVTAAAAVGGGIGVLAKVGIDELISSVTESEQTLGTWIYELVHGEEEARNLADGLLAVTRASEKTTRAARERAKAEEEAASAARKAAVDARDAALDTARAQVRAAEQALAARKRTVTEALAAEERYTKRSKDLAEEQRNANLSASERLREIWRSQASDGALAKDLWREIVALMAKAKETTALDPQKAREYAEKVQEIAERLASITNDKGKYVYYRRGVAAFKEASALIQGTYDQEIKAAEKAATAEEQKATRAREAIATEEEALRRLVALIETIDNRAASPSITADTREAQSDILELEASLARLSDKTITVTTVQRNIEARQYGGPVGLTGFNTGGAINLAAGGHLPGYGGGDRRLVLAEDGEYVVRKEAVARYWSVINAINHGRDEELWRLLAGMGRQSGAPAGFQLGGVIGGGAGTPTAHASTPNPVDVLRIELMTGPGESPVSVFADRDNARRLANTLKRMGRTQ